MDLTALKSLSLAINLSHNDPSLVSHLSGWTAYAWTEAPITSCAPTTNCVLPRQRWDWHRPQWVDFAFAYDAKRDRTVVTLTLTDEDPSDDDFVCVTAAFLTPERVPALVFHQNWHIGPGEVITRRFAFGAAGRWPSVNSVALGSKQCRSGGAEDDAVYAAALKRLDQKPPVPVPTTR